MHQFTYRSAVLHAESVDLRALADAVGTPFYCYSRATMERHYRVFSEAFGDLPTLICYAMKANSNQAVLRLFGRLGAGMDVVSEGELRRARAAGIDPGRITFSGVGKTEREIAFAIDENIQCFNIESEAELRTVSQIANAKGRTARVSLRVNPDIDAQTHANTGVHAGAFAVSSAPDVVTLTPTGHRYRRPVPPVLERLPEASAAEARLASLLPVTGPCRDRSGPRRSWRDVPGVDVPGVDVHRLDASIELLDTG